MLILIICIFQNAELFYTARNFFKGNTPYSQIDVIANGSGLRLLYYIIVTGCILAFISIVPKCHVFFTPYEKRTLTIMVLHIPVKELVFRFGIYTFLTKQIPAPWWKMIYLLLAIAVTFLLGNKKFDQAVRTCIYWQTNTHPSVKAGEKNALDD